MGQCSFNSVETVRVLYLNFSFFFLLIFLEENNLHPKPNFFGDIAAIAAI